MTKLEERWELTRETVGNGRLSVIMPVYNLEGEVVGNLRETAALFEAHKVHAELLPVDDGSADGTSAALSALAADFKFEFVTMRPVLCKRNGGKGAALRAGFAASTGEYVMLLDGDLDIHPKQTPWFFDQMVAKGADVVVGSKRHRRSVVQYPWHRRLVSIIYFTLVRIFVGLPITDTQTGMKLFKREVLREAIGRMLVKQYAFDLELLAIAHQRGAKIAEAPVVIRFGNKFGCLKSNTVKSMAMDSLAVFYRLRILNYYMKAEVPKRLDHDPLVSIVIACPGDSWMLQECLNGIRTQSYENYEVIILPDNAFELSRPNPAAGENVAREVVIATGKVRPAEKRNIGIAAAKGEVIAFIDDDAYPDSHWLEYAIKYFGDETIGGVGGPGVTPPNDPFLAKVGGRVYDSLLVSGNYRYRYKPGGVRRDVDDYPSCNLFVRKATLEKFGGYRTDFWPGEDTLLCKDIIDSGKRIVYDPWVIVYHHRRALFAAHLRQLGRYAFHRGYFVKRFPSNSLHLSYFFPSILVAYLAFGVLDLALGFTCGIQGQHNIVFGSCKIAVGAAVFYAPLAVYAALVVLTTFALNPAVWLMTALGVVASHVWYGIKFVHGLCSRRAPCEFIGKDHA